MLNSILLMSKESKLEHKSGGTPSGKPTNDLYDQQKTLPVAATSPSEVAASIKSGPIHGRVLVIGLPHTGTTSIEVMLRKLGCCFSTHNLDSTCPSVHNVSWTWAWTGGDACQRAPSVCAKTLLEEATHFQCLADNPWSSHWRSLTATDPTAFVVLSRSMSVFHYTMTLSTFWRQHVPKNAPPINVSLAAAEYEARLAEVRAAQHKSPRYFEICLQCGDDIWTLARSLRLDVTHLELPSEEVHAFKSSDDEDVRAFRANFTAEYMSLLSGRPGGSITSRSHSVIKTSGGG
eukprot:CAMPEP_0119299928 /NCGR_PEP_ID=MMETSP1333-20130426/1947_1 /TAXON_ID=418940 /ORGANISM="Scyphosphaera apsteinii, Strain RCC1455" /LENGTH=289 /DNA_ID=CAMNT_0007301533 /DNA_START=143 /DNA_END=1009 /DNA_ORIENTATION=+